MEGCTGTPRLARALLCRSLDAADRDAILAELDEMFELRRAEKGVAAARRWYWRQVPSFALRLSFDRLRHRRRRGGDRGLMDTLGQDLRDGWRRLIANRSLTAVTLLTLALGIGACTTLFSVVNGVLWTPLPYAQPERLFWVHTWSEPNRWPFSVADFQALRGQTQAFSGVAGFTYTRMTHARSAGSQQLIVQRTTAEFFSVLGSEPLIGRTFASGEDAPGAERVAILSHGFWQRELGSDASVLNETIRLDGVEHAIIGVLPLEVGPLEDPDVDLWTALELTPPTRKGPFFLRVVGRLADGVTSQQAQDELHRLNDALFPLWQSSYQDEAASWALLPLRDYVVGDAAHGLYLMFAAVGCVLLIATINLGSLLLTRALARRHELALRTAVGASRWRLFRQLMAEALVVVLLGGLGGLLLAHWGTRWLITVLPDALPRAAEIGTSWRVAGFALGVSLLAGAIVGLAASLRGSAANPGILLRSGGRTSSSRSSVGSFLVVSQLALAVPVLVSSGLLLQSFVRLQDVDPGFDAERVVSMRIGLSRLHYSEDADVAAFWNRALAGVRSLPGVDAAGLGDGRPPHEAPELNNFDLESRPTPPGESQPVAPWLTVTPGYFRTLGIPLRRGHLIAESDTQDQPPVVVVDEAWARKHFPGGDPVGQRFMSGGCTPDRCDWVTIVGVVGDVKYTGLDNEDGSIYFPHGQTSYRSMYVFARSRDTRPSDLIPGMRQVIGELDPMLVVSDVRSGDELVAESLVGRRFLMRLVSSFGWVAALLAALGIYGVMSYFVQQRTREIGVRIAVGGRRRDVVRWLLGHGLRLTLGGLALGLVLAALTTRTLDSLLFAVKASDPATFLGASGLLAAAALLACWLPARRACRVDPVAALRGD